MFHENVVMCSLLCAAIIRGYYVQCRSAQHDVYLMPNPLFPG